MAQLPFPRSTGCPWGSALVDNEGRWQETEEEASAKASAAAETRAEAEANARAVAEARILDLEEQLRRVRD